MTTESYENGAMTSPRMNVSGYVGHATIFIRMLTWLVTSRHDTTRSTCRALEPMHLAVSSWSNSTAWHARHDALDTSNVSCRVKSQVDFGLYVRRSCVLCWWKCRAQKD